MHAGVFSLTRKLAFGSWCSQPATNLSSFDYVYILGGDSYDGDDTRRNFKPGLLDTNWENGYKNDGIHAHSHLHADTCPIQFCCPSPLLLLLIAVTI